MFSNNQLLLGLMLATISKVMMIAPASALPDAGPPQSNFVPDDSANFFSGSFVNGTGGEGLTNGISVPPGISFSDAPSGTNSSGAGSSSTGSSSTGTGTGTGTGTVTVADIANYLTSNIDRSLNEVNIPDVAQQPRRIVRRRRAVCPNPQISRSSESLDDLLKQSEQFIKEVNQIKPENSIW